MKITFIYRILYQPFFSFFLFLKKNSFAVRVEIITSETFVLIRFSFFLSQSKLGKMPPTSKYNVNVN